MALLRSTLSRLPATLRSDHGLVATMCSADGMPTYDFDTLKVTRPATNVVEVQLNRPDKLNAMNQLFWREIRDCFHQLDEDPDCRAVVLSASGRLFTAGLDLMDHTALLAPKADADAAREAFKMRKFIQAYQDSFTAIEQCSKPVIAAIHSACIGGGVDMVSACDVRFCSADAFFSIKEVAIGLAADVGTLQRMPKIVGNDSLMRELALTGRKMLADEAKDAGFVSRVLTDREELNKAALETATLIASHSPVAVQGTKINLNYARDHTVAEGLDFATHWNMVMIQTADLPEAAQASMMKTTPKFSKL